MEKRMKLNDEIVESALDFIKRRDNFLITTHLNADGDAYGASLAVAYLLKKMGKTYSLVFHDSPIDPKYHFLQNWDEIISFDDNINWHYDAAIIVDVPAMKRIGKTACLVPPAEHCLKIDHHPIEEDFADHNLVDTSASSTCQIIYEMIWKSNSGFDVQIAKMLLSGIMYDTGRFSFSNTTARDFEIAAHLSSIGATPWEITTALFFNNNPDTIRILGMGLSQMESFLDGKVNVIFLPKKIMDTANDVDLDDLANYSSAVRGGEVGVFIREINPGEMKISFRSNGRVNVNVIARRFGGGGHIHAAGCRFTGEPANVKYQIIEAINEQLCSVL